MALIRCSYNFSYILSKGKIMAKVFEVIIKETN